MAKISYPSLLFPAILLLSFFFSAHSMDPTDFSAHSMDPTDFSALRRIRNSLTEIPSPRFFSTWNFSHDDPCSSFSGVTCSPSSLRVTSLTLGTGLSDSPSLAGTLSPAVSYLADLTQLILFPGIVSGPIPPQIGSLQNLRDLSLTSNRLTGEIPTTIFLLPNLHTLDLSRNQLSGAVPPEIPALSRLKVLVLASNRLYGRPPRGLPDQLLHLDLSNNFFYGDLPPRMPPALRYLSVANNRMWGPIDALDPLSELAYVDLSSNEFGGPIPVSLFRPTVTSMLLQRNNFTGRVPQSAPWPCSAVDLSHNSLSGELSGVLSGVEALYLNNNRIHGVVPEEYAESVEKGTMRTLYLQHNYLTGFPMEVGSTLPDAAAVCVSYNCMITPPVGLAACPSSAGEELSRPAYQCAEFH